MKILLLVSVLTIASFAQNIITETQIAVWEQFKKQYIHKLQ
jgi:endo-1,4-beta-D-glucanase Y